MLSFVLALGYGTLWVTFLALLRRRRCFFPKRLSVHVARMGGSGIRRASYKSLESHIFLESGLICSGKHSYQSIMTVTWNWNQRKHRFDCRAFSMRYCLYGHRLNIPCSRIFICTIVPNTNPADHSYFVSFSGVMANVGRTNLQMVSKRSPSYTIK